MASNVGPSSVRRPVYGQWGLNLWGPAQALTNSPTEIARRTEDFWPRDLIIGEFLGDQVRLVIRCDLREDDFGSVLVELEIDPRKDWPTVGINPPDFLEQFVNASGDKFWEYS